MKKLFTIIALTISFSMNAQLIPVTENGTTGQRLSTSNEANHGDIGSNAVDLSNSDSASTTRGATGDSSTAMGQSTTASGIASTAMGGYTTASGIASTAMGQSTEASGTASTAMGGYTTASAFYSTAMGGFTTASGSRSTATGYSTIASGDFSTAMGRNSKASDFGSTVIGQYNSSGSTVTNSATAFNAANTAFVIGNGTGTGEDASDAFKVMFNGDTYVSSSLYLGGTEITSTAAELNLLSGATSLGTGILSPVTENSNTGVRLSTAVAANHGDIGSNAVDLSNSDSASTTRGATGESSTAMGTNTTASGTYSTAMGRSTEASGESSTAMGYLTTASGNSSTAMGGGTTASAFYSTAMGELTEASGEVSTAMGGGTTASGEVSTAMGDGTIASGSRSTAMGQSTKASDFGSTVIGQYNSSGSTVTNSATVFNAANTAFVIGNGTGTGEDASDAFKVMFNGDTYVSSSLYLGGTEITSTAAELNLLSGATSLGTGILSPVTENLNTGVRLSTAVADNYGDIGSNAVDLSNSDSASTTRGATGESSTAMGRGTTASGDVSTAMGVFTTASGSRSTAMGRSTTASASYSTAMGDETTASGSRSTAMGYGTEASGYASTAMGGGTEASGYASTAMGESTTASDFGSTVIGQYNSSGSTVTNSATVFNAANTAFVIGNGTGTGEDASDAFKVMFNGDTYVSSSLYLGGTEITSTAAELNLLSGATSLGTGILSPVTENSNTGVRLSTAVAANHGDIGSNAVDLSYSSSASTTSGATGAASTAMGTNTSASGDYSTAMGYSTEASGGDSTAMGDGTTASGDYSTAMGSFTEASGTASTAMGEETTASGDFSTAMGAGTTASGNASTAMGYSTEASGYASTAMGESTTASDFGSTVIGQYNSSGSTVTNSATAFNAANTAFVIGNGTGTGEDASDAFKVMFNGDTYVSSSLYLGGTEITSTAAELNLLSGATSLGTGILSPVTENSNTGVRLSTAVADNHGDIGSNAVDLSYSTGASTTRGATGYASTAMGTNTTASGAFSTAMGELTEASGEVSTAMGYLTTASGSISTAMGYETTASGEVSTAMGQSTEASGDYSTAMGRDTEASGDYSTAMGISTKASGSISTAMGGGTTASGNSSTAMGQSTTASDFGSTVIGQYNSSGSTVTNSATAFNAANTAFVIGNGVDGSNTSDAFKVMFNGDTYVSSSLYLGGTEITSTAAELNLLSGATSLGTGILSPVTENLNTGVRLSTAVAANHGDIGINAVDLSYSSSPSTTRGATGDYSTAMGDETTASGSRSTAMGRSTEASGYASTAMGRSTEASGGYSTAMGQSTEASGYASTAMGYSTEASGDYSTAMGISTKASGSISTAMGGGTEASGTSSTAMGESTTASDFGSTVIGQYNSSGSTVTNSATAFNAANTAFVIGNGTGTGEDASDAFKVMFNGDTYVSSSLYLGGTEITSTAAELNLLSGATSLGTGILSPVTENSNTGVRLSTAVADNHGDIGINAVDLSYSTVASTTRGATGDYSTAMGINTEASGNFSTAMGGGTTASGNVSTAMGSGTEASGDYSTAMGASTTASGIASTAMGSGTEASGIGSTAMGANTTASDYGSLVIGQHNSSGSSVTNSATVFNSANTAFVIGNGADGNNISDAFSILFDGSTNIAGSVTATSFVGDGSQLTGITGSASSLNDLTDVLVDSNNSMFLGTPPANSTGEYNTALGYKPLYSNTEGDNNTALGENALYSNTTGDDNTASGSGALATNTTGNNNTALGYNAVASSAEAINQTIIGYEATGVADNSVVLGNEDVTAVYMGEDSGATVYAAGLNIGGTEITSTATELNLLTGATSLGTGILSPVTENSNTGVRLSTAVAANYGDIGSNAVDLSYSNSASTTNGATGESSTAMGAFTTASGNASTAMGDGTTASAFYSTAMGSFTEASGTASTAMGDETTASGYASTAMGRSTEASGYASTAMGRSTEASGDYSTAMGYSTEASDFGSTVIGQYNSSGSTVTNSATVFNAANTAFVIGNGTGTGEDASDAFKVMFNGDTYVSSSLYLGGTEITSTAAELNLLSGATSLGTGILSPVTENLKTGVRLSTAVAANHGDIGINAVDLSYSSSPSTTRGATGDYSTAMGISTTASGNASTAMGGGTTASGSVSTAIGVFTTASGDNSTAMGANTTASDYGSLVIGQHNSSGSSVTNSATVFNAANTAFVIGNGVDGSNTSDAFKVLFNGDATVGNDLTVSGDVVINSDMRLKANILSLGSTLYKLLQIDGKTYTMKRDATKKQKIGLLAQDIEKVFPELVVENKGIKSVNYQGLVPVLINALKEQQSEIDALKKQEKRLERLELIISNMDK